MRSHHSYSKSSKSSSFIHSMLTLLVLLAGLSYIVSKFASASSSELIPEDAIRIRIIASSDGKFDQEVKANIRDDVARYIQSWGGMPSTHDEAKALIESRLPA